MPRSVKVSALLAFGLAILLFPFFEVCKHAPALSAVNPFAEDPYDAVGSFGIQLAPFLSLIALLRAFRPYPSEQAPDSQRVLYARAACCSCLSVAVTLAADVIAMVRHPSLWIGVPGGSLLAAMLGGMALLTALVFWFIYRAARSLPSRAPLQRWTQAGVCSLAGILILVFYPEELRQSTLGGLLTIAVGAIFLFSLVCVLGTAIVPFLKAPFEDVIDDIVAAYRWEKAHADPADPSLVIDGVLEKLLTLSPVRVVFRWLNPRRYPWNIVLLIGIFMGIALLLSEKSEAGGPHQPGKLFIVAAVFIGAECGGVLLGYVLLAKPLGLFRRDARSHHVI